MASKDSFGARSDLEVGGTTYEIFRVDAVEGSARLPFTHKVLLENLLRTEDGANVTRETISALGDWDASAQPSEEIQFTSARVIMQDFTGVPVVVDLATMREAVKDLGGDPAKIEPLAPSELVIDHSVIADFFGTADAEVRNVTLEYERNRERYQFLRWGQGAFEEFKVVPPGTGIVHQVNIEALARVVMARGGQAYPDTVVGTDSHTTMVNGLGVLGWGVGGIEAEAVMLGQPIYMLAPEVIGFRLYGQLREGVTATDLVLTITQMLRARGVVGKFVEFFGEALDTLGVPDRATIGNMSPEYGATMGFFPIDSLTLDYLRMTGRSDDEVDLVERYTKEQGLFRAAGAPPPEYTDVVELDASTVAASLAGPRRPQDRVALPDVKTSFRAALTAPLEKRGFALSESALSKTVTVRNDGRAMTLAHGSVVIASITSCTNTSNPSVLVAAGLLARKAVERGLRTRPWVKTSLAPGSQVVTGYLRESGLLAALEELRFHVVGYGCTTCIGNSGPLPEPVSRAITEGGLVVAAVLSGNRNFEGRIHPLVRANYLASPPLVVAYALAGTMDIDLVNEPLGTGSDGKPVYLADLWPTPGEIRSVVESSVRSEMFRQTYANVFEGDENWKNVPAPTGMLYEWDPQSTYIKAPPFFDTLTPDLPPLRAIRGARALAVLGHSVTTDHISPAGSIAPDSPAGKYLMSLGIEPKDFNSYGARRGNHEVMIRGTFANVRLRNELVPGVEGGVTIHLPDGDELCVIINHMVCDGAGFKEVLYELAENYSRILAGGKLLPCPEAPDSRRFSRLHG